MNARLRIVLKLAYTLVLTALLVVFASSSVDFVYRAF